MNWLWNIDNYGGVWKWFWNRILVSTCWNSIIGNCDADGDGDDDDDDDDDDDGDDEYQYYY